MAATSVLVVSLFASEEAIAQALAKQPAAELVRPLEEDFDELHGRWHDATSSHVVMVAADIAAVRLALPVLASIGSTRELTLVLPDEEARELAGKGAGVDGAQVCLRFRAPTPLHKVLTDLVADVPRRCPSRPASGLRIAAADPVALAWCVGDASARTTANADAAWRGDETRGDAVDVVLHTTARTAASKAADFAVDVTALCAPVDIGVTNPAGFDPHADSEAGYVVVTDIPQGQEVRVATAEVDVMQFGSRARLTSAALDRARALRYVEATAIHHAAPELAAHLLTQLGAAGVPLVTGRLPAAVEALLHTDVVAALAQITPDATTDAELREGLSIRLRRAVMRRHSHSSVWRDLRASLGFTPPPTSTVSVQLVTKRRQFLEHAVRSVAQQEHVDAELVLVTHGFTLSAAEVTSFAALLPFPLVTATIRDDAYFGDALNVALDHTSGDLVAKMDDDDWYGPHHLEDLVQTMAWSGATLVGAVHQYTYLADADVTVRRRVATAKRRRPAHVPGGTMLLRREDLLAVGGWRPLRQFGPEDLALSHAIRESGGTLQDAHGLGFVLCRHGRGHTWNVSSERFLEGADQQWAGFHAPPELGDGAVTRDHYADVLAAARAAAG